eukprot:FR735188.1.p1 GENE.FR735188.1~~FR735188.1.p1  ORF type:complete len:151 (+),score=24.08 FR735188.1:264-716(+)
MGQKQNLFNFPADARRHLSMAADAHERTSTDHENAIRAFQKSNKAGWAGQVVEKLQAERVIKYQQLEAAKSYLPEINMMANEQRQQSLAALAECEAAQAISQERDNALVEWKAKLKAEAKERAEKKWAPFGGRLNSAGRARRLRSSFRRV